MKGEKSLDTAALSAEVARMTRELGLGGPSGAGHEFSDFAPGAGRKRGGEPPRGRDGKAIVLVLGGSCQLQTGRP